jgi:hypothetical protein
MPEETKITSNTLWSWVKSNIGTIIVITGLGVNAFISYGKKEVSSYQQSKDQVELKTDVKSIQTAISIQNQTWTQFSNNYKTDRAKDTVRLIKVLKGVTVLNSALEKHFKNSKLDSEYIQFLKDQLNVEKKNPFLNWTP